MAKKEVVRKIDFGIEEAILAVIILLNVFNFLSLLEGELRYVKEVVSWVTLGYIVYKASPTSILFGEKNSDVDMLIIISYFLLVIKNMVAFAVEAWETSSSFMLSFYKVLIDNAAQFEVWGFIIGSFMLIVVAFYAAIKLHVRKPSLLHVIHEEGKVTDMKKFTERFVSIFVVLLAFFILVFNLILEWLQIALDSSIIFFAVLFILFFFIKHARKFHVDSFVFKLSESIEGFYEDFIEHLKYKEKLLLGIAGLLSLHMLTDLGNFILPYLFPVYKSAYLSEFAIGHLNVFQLIRLDFAAALAYEKIFIVLGYLLNSIAIIFLLSAPAVLWFFIYKKKKIFIHKWLIFTLYTSLTAFILSPSFTISPINGRNIIGVDINTYSFLSSAGGPAAIIIASIIVGLVALALSEKKRMEKALTTLLILFSFGFFAAYIYHFFLEIISYYWLASVSLISSGSYYLALIFFLLFAINLMFYIGGFAVFVWEMCKKLKDYLVVD